MSSIFSNSSFHNPHFLCYSLYLWSLKSKWFWRPCGTSSVWVSLTASLLLKLFLFFSSCTCYSTSAWYLLLTLSCEGRGIYPLVPAYLPSELLGQVFVTVFCCITALHAMLALLLLSIFSKESHLCIRSLYRITWSCACIVPLVSIGSLSQVYCPCFMVVIEIIDLSMLVLWQG